MTKVQNKARRQVVSIDTGRQSLTRGIEDFRRGLLANRLYVDSGTDWSTTLARLKAEISQIDRAILALTQLAIRRGQRALCLSPIGAAEQTEGREFPPKQKTR